MLAHNFRGAKAGEIMQARSGAAIARGRAVRSARGQKSDTNPLILPCVGITTAVAIGVAALYATQAKAIRRIQTGLAKERQDRAVLAASVRTAKETQRQDSLFTARVEALQRIDEDRFLWPHVMEALQDAVPAGVWLTAVEEKRAGKDPSIGISGHAIRSNDITSFIDGLQQSLWFERPRLISTDQTSRKHGPVTAFKVEVLYHEPADSSVRQFIELRPSSGITLEEVLLRNRRPTPATRGTPSSPGLMPDAPLPAIPAAPTPPLRRPS